MLKKLTFAFSVLALAVASAGTVPAPGSTFKVKLLQPSVVNGTVLKAGEYRLKLGDAKVTLTSEKQNAEAKAATETVQDKFDTTAICYRTEEGKAVITEIRLGGTKTKIVFNN